MPGSPESALPACRLRELLLELPAEARELLRERLAIVFLRLARVFSVASVSSVVNEGFFGIVIRRTLALPHWKRQVDDCEQAVGILEGMLDAMQAC